MHEWWSLQPERCGDYERNDPYQQIVCQIAGIYESIKFQREANPQIPIFDMEYKSLCADPEVILNQIQSFCVQRSINLDHRTRTLKPPFLVASGPRQDEQQESSYFESLFKRGDIG